MRGWIVGAIALVLASCATGSTAHERIDGAHGSEVTAPPTSPDESGLRAPSAAIERVLFDGSDLTEWALGVYGESEEYEVSEGGVVLPQTAALAGMTYRGRLPESPYRLIVDATKLYGSDFHLGVTFPVRDDHLTLVLGGWGGTVSGLSSLDGLDASRNATRTLRHFPNGKRQRVEIDVRDDAVQVFLDGEPLLSAPLEGVELGLRVEVEPSKPLGVATFATSTLLHGVTVLEQAR